MNSTFSLRIGLDALRANPLRTILSTLGVIMGVAAMVAVLAIGDGVEIYGRSRVARLTDIQAVFLTPQVFQRVDGIFMARPDVVTFSPADLAELRAAAPEITHAVIEQASGTIVQVEGNAARGRGVMVMAASPEVFTVSKVTLAVGAPFTDADVAAAHAVVVLSASAADTLANGAGASLLGKRLLMQDRPFTITGILAAREDGERMQAFVPFGTSEGLGMARRGGGVAAITVVARSVEAVDTLQRQIEKWAAAKYGDKWKDRVNIVVATERLKEIARVFLVFKLLMVSITGVSLLVGGIGIMNVLLASVQERTREIGIRKAAGARHVDILRQFLAESVSITGAGAMLGTLLGLGIAFTAAAVMRWRTQAPVHAAVTAGTILFAAAASITVGLGFGLYPALRAARLSPIDAIRHE